MTAKKCTKKRDARAKLLFCQSKPFAFLPFSLTSPSSLRKLPNYVIEVIMTITSPPNYWSDYNLEKKTVEKIALLTIQTHPPNRPFYRYGGHIELIRFKEYYKDAQGA